MFKVSRPGFRISLLLLISCTALGKLRFNFLIDKVGNNNIYLKDCCKPSVIGNVSEKHLIV